MIKVTIRENEVLRGFEIKFSERPSRKVLDWLKACTFRWSRRKELWYTKKTMETATIVENIKAAIKKSENYELVPEVDYSTEETVLELSQLEM